MTDLDWRGGADAVERWLKRQNQTEHRKQASQGLIEALRQGQQTQLTPRQRLEALEAIGPALGQNLAEQHQKLTEVQFPLDPRTRQAAAAADRIALGAIGGYQTILRQLHEAAQQGQKTPGGLWQTLAHRILFYSFLAVRNHSLLDQPPPKQLWLRINRLYLLAKKQKQADRIIEFPGFPGYLAATLDQLYKRTLLLSLIPLHGITAVQTEELKHSLSLWERDIEIKVCREDMDREQHPFQIDPMSDRPPSPAADHCQRCAAGKCALMDMGKLAAHLAHLSSQAQQENLETLTLNDDARISVATLETLRQFWRQRPQRNDQRDAEPDATVEAVFSIRGICKALEMPPPGSAATPEPAQTRGMDFLLDDEPGLALHDDTPAAPDHEALTQTPKGLAFSIDDFEDPAPTSAGLPAFGDKAPVAPALSSTRQPLDDDALLDPWKARDSLAERFFSAEVRDRSNFGLQLKIVLPGTLKLGVGDIIGLREHGAAPPAVCMVRWIRETEARHLIFGVERIAEQARAVTLAVASKQLISRNLPAVVGRHPRSGKTLLVLPFIQDVRQTPLLLECCKRELPIALAGPPAEAGKGFEAYEFGVRKAGELVPDPKAPLFSVEILDGLAADAG